MDGICPGIRRKRGSRDGAGTVWTGRLRSRLAGLKACTWLAALQTGRQIRTQVCESGLERNLSSLVDFYCECGRMGEARQVFDLFGSKTKDSMIWTTGYSRQGQTESAIDFFNLKQDRGLRPDAITFTFILAACSHAGLVDKGKEYFELEHYRRVVRLDERHGAALSMANIYWSLRIVTDSRKEIAGRRAS
ncbi:pentatricopeptide repeat-containing protein At2g02750-like isoform X1 [Selaginella moellendorffii]|uniref:pentatricopeptide repeat-containing protein At2g02750-like isoform X1 n=1 Tax=Selaginella moellendorffii TaxID=88036 RepID=UPI000D1C40C2|nr:pentatricopeptide repeat-containing protein At2g02750-like isoform X1 [Selaginella moellendorffii]XP_024519035.1 pentatricopeptide repeat-containing protein At2g02750-like isoform X1 [Selaginella moellendorffii]XP_024519036.1 pentatricopeptide repeat-containing protein At2g02750-like isoform X1 [Selaginella moellendorffii]|eukprot:XP_024519034.1 pentatricopeptide repeat-containing protein At2g02750-like isoform X1 [Selaginella moellendorffii]